MLRERSSGVRIGSLEHFDRSAARSSGLTCTTSAFGFIYTPIVGATGKEGRGTSRDMSFRDRSGPVLALPQTRRASL